MKTRFALQPIDESFFESAPVRHVDTLVIPRPAESVWTDLTSDNPLSWCRILDRITWTSPRPFGVGATRSAYALRGVQVLDERFFRWEEGHRMSFGVERGSLPLFRRFGEDYLLEPDGAGACRFTWTIAYEASLISRPGEPLNARLFGSLFADTRNHYGVG